MKTPPCQIALYPTTYGPIPSCGRRASWSSDDVSRDGSTTWMCDEHKTEMERSVDDAEFSEVAS